jgi:hypothetical protein
MTPAPPISRRLPALACTLALGATLLLSACGGDGSAAAENKFTTHARQPAKVAVAGQPPCPTKVTAFANSLDQLRQQLAIGLSYKQYAATMKGLRRKYDAIPIDRLTIGCLATTGTPAERTFNSYVDAANAWGECLADASCTTAAIEPVLQRKWRVASGLLSGTR